MPGESTSPGSACRLRIVPLTGANEHEVRRVLLGASHGGMCLIHRRARGGDLLGTRTLADESRSLARRVALTGGDSRGRLRRIEILFADVAVGGEWRESLQILRRSRRLGLSGANVCVSLLDLRCSRPRLEIAKLRRGLVGGGFLNPDVCLKCYLRKPNERVACPHPLSLLSPDLRHARDDERRDVDLRQLERARALDRVRGRRVTRRERAEAPGGRRAGSRGQGCSHLNVDVALERL